VLDADLVAAAESPGAGQEEEQGQHEQPPPQGMLSAVSKGKPGRAPLAATTLQGYRINVERHLVPALGQKGVGQLTVSDLDTFASRNRPHFTPVDRPVDGQPARCDRGRRRAADGCRRLGPHLGGRHDLHHDRGSEYTSATFRAACRELGRSSRHHGRGRVSTTRSPNRSSPPRRSNSSTVCTSLLGLMPAGRSSPRSTAPCNEPGGRRHALRQRDPQPEQVAQGTCTSRDVRILW
jgi:hypothetical protein